MEDVMSIDGDRERRSFVYIPLEYFFGKRIQDIFCDGTLQWSSSEDRVISEDAHTLDNFCIP